jgi:RNA polymerase sigma factor (sigma-70 family)
MGSPIRSDKMRTDDGYIINKCLNGEPEAFGLLVDKYKAGIFAFVYARLHNFHDAEDVTQNVFIKAYRSLHTLKRWDSFVGWLYRIASNFCKDSILSQSRRPDRKFIEDQDPTTLEKPSIDTYHDDMICESLHEALDSLPETYRQVLTLYYLGGMDSGEIAKALCTSPTAIRHRLSRAREQLKEEVLAMIDKTYERQRLQASFTFRIVETIKRIKISPVSTSKGLPWGLSLATGMIIAFLSIGSHLDPFNIIDALGGYPLPSESRVLKVGEIPVDVLKISEMAVISSKMGKGRGIEPAQFNMQNSFFMAPQGEGEWTRKADIPTARSRLCTVVLNGKIYAIGGESWAGVLSNVEEYDPIEDKWEIRSNMPQAKELPCAISFNGKIYVFGGYDVNFNRPTSVHEYDPALDKWIAKRDMPEKFFPYYPYVLNSKIYVLGAKCDADWNIISKQVYVFDPTEDSWTEKPNKLINANGNYCLVNGKIYAIGGFGGGACLSTVGEYDPVTDTLKKKSDMPTSRFSLNACAVGTKIYAMGGSNNPNGFASLTTVEIYDTLTDTWTKGVDMQSSRYAFSASVIGGRIYCIGGWDIVANVLPSAVEEFDTGFISVDPNGKLPKTWGKIKSR